jgi:hypothetical protein
MSGADVDDLPQKISCPAPKRPSVLTRGDIEADATAAFIVSGDGTVEPGSIEVTTEHEWMESAVRAMVAECTFRPGRVDGQPVRIRLSMPIAYQQRMYRYRFTPYESSQPPVAARDEESEQALQDIGEWFDSALVEFGDFSIGMRADAGNVVSSRLEPVVAREVTARHQIRDVSMQGCELRFTTQILLQESTAPPLFWQITLPLRSIDIGASRVQAYETSYGFRTSGTGAEVYLQALASSDGFPIQSSHTGSETWYNLGLPLGRKNHAREVLDALERAVRLCRAL